MDNDPSQTSKAARKAMGKIEAEFHKIPATSPHLNPIENLFHLIRKSLENEAIANNIT
jgi:transposase